MLIAQGYFDASGTPYVKLKLAGVFGSGAELEAIIDTGFTGFVSIPLIKAFPIGLPLCGTTSCTFADGSSGNKLTALGTITLEDDAGSESSQAGVVILEENSTDILVGMDFLRSFKAVIVMTKDKILLLEADWMDKILNKADPSAKSSNNP